MHDEERSGLDARARMLNGRARRRLTGITGALAAVVMTFALAEPAQASAEYFSSVYVQYSDGGDDTYGGLVGMTVPQHYVLDSTGGAAYADASDTNGGTASVNVAVIGQGPVQPELQIASIVAVSRVTYRFFLSGPTTGGTVPVLLSGAGASTGGRDYLSVQNFYQQGNFDVSQVLNLVPGSQYTMELYADAAVFNYGIAGDRREQGATVDPTLTIQGADAQLYHFVGLPDSTIGGSIPAVPEPTSWAMMVGGMGFVGLAMRRRRTRAHFA